MNTIENLQEDALLLEPRERFDSCIIGTCSQTGRVVYDENKILNVLMEDAEEINELDTNDEHVEQIAREYYEFNILGAYMGEMTPMYVNLLEEKFVVDVIS